MLINREKVTKQFIRYVENYDATNPKIKLKIDHTKRVAELCEQIAGTLECDEKECSLAWLIGMLHDIGRFEQLRQFNTFEDSKSVNHAELGCHILFDEGHIRDYLEENEYDTLIHDAIYWHSAYRIPEDMTKQGALYCNILRDADKIDIIRVNATVPLWEIYDVSREAIEVSEITPAVRESFYEKHATKRSIKVTPMNYVVAHISLAFELVYPISRELMLTQGYLMQLMQTPSSNPQTRKTMEELQQFMLKELTTK